MSRIAFLQDLLSSVFLRQDDGDRLGDDNSLLELCDDLLSERGEMSGNRIARTLLARLEGADQNEARAFFDLLVARFDLNAQHAVRAAEHYAADNSVQNMAILMSSVEPRRQELFRRLNRVDGATGQIVRLRARLLVVFSSCEKSTGAHRQMFWKKSSNTRLCMRLTVGQHFAVAWNQLIESVLPSFIRRCWMSRLFLWKLR